MRTTVAFAVAAFTMLAAGGALQVSANFAGKYADYVTQAFENSSRDDESYLRFEWEGYDGWYNNPAHPDWGGAG